MRRTGLLIAAALGLLAACTSIAPPVQKSVRIGDTDIAYVEQGRGPPVVFVHGAAGDCRNWDEQRKVLAKDFRVIAMSHRFHYPNGGMGGDLALHSLPQQGRDLEQFIQALGAGPVHLVAHSNGGYGATRVAIDRPDLVKSLVLEEPHVAALMMSAPNAKELVAIRTQAIQSAIKAESGEQAVKTIMDWVIAPGGFDALSPARQNVMRTNAATMQPMLKAPGQVPLTCEMVGRIRAPTLLLVGRDSQPYWKAIADEFQRCRPATTRVVLPGRHFLDEADPGAFNAALLRFLEAQR